ncbi:TetR/AcrR family transcriptional regulator [Desulfovibrio sp. UCD-KL4C]|uniref:TetR/AcrR family transcriptional regulator n=1 Tax=Desulfovibrio sp. UCD-KL4C TaxID=2578120 RepID=UPI0025C48C64|nr:TetR/AcrR family transcriptional regulator [Desulfovibrio sp. UCD-KL4C]
MVRKHGNFEPCQQRADVTKNKILEAALIVFSEKGFVGANTKNIADAAGVATGSVYRYFKDKMALFLAVRAMLEGRMSIDVFEKSQSLLEQGEEVNSILNLLVRYCVDSHREHRKFFCEVLALEAIDEVNAAIGRERDRRVRRKFYDFFLSLGGGIQADDLEAATELICMTVEEVAHKAILFKSDVGEDRLIAQLVKMLSNYLLFPDSR